MWYGYFCNTERAFFEKKPSRRSSEVGAAAPVSHLLVTLKQEVEAAKLRDKMFEIDLMNMVASDDIIWTLWNIIETWFS